MSEQLAQQKCTPCSEGGQPLKGESLQPYARQTPDWQIVEEHHLSRTFTFDDFLGALEFVNQVGSLAEEQQHHPDIYLTYGKVRIELHTHKIDGLSANDFILAAKIDRLES